MGVEGKRGQGWRSMVCKAMALYAEITWGMNIGREGKRFQVDPESQLDGEGPAHKDRSCDAGEGP